MNRLRKAWYSLKSQYPNFDISERRAFFTGASEVLTAIFEASQNETGTTFATIFNSMVSEATREVGAASSRKDVDAFNDAVSLVKVIADWEREHGTMHGVDDSEMNKRSLSLLTKLSDWALTHSARAIDEQIG